MTTGELPPSARLHGFHELMRTRVQRILLVSTLYDSFIMSEEGRLHETLLTQFIALNNHQTFFQSITMFIIDSQRISQCQV